MERKRKVYAPFSQTSEAGVTQTPVEGYIDVNQMIYPTVNTGVVNEKGQWAGVKSDDIEFIDITKHVAVANGGATLSPDTGTKNFIDMSGFSSLFIAIKPTNTGNYKIESVMGPDTVRFANLTPVTAAAGIKKINVGQNAFALAVDDSAENLADTWNIFAIYDVLKGQQNMQFRITNNSGGESTIEVGFMRLV